MHPAQYRAQAGPSAGRSIATRAAGQALEGIVRAFGADHRADKRKLIRHSGHAGKFFADLDAGHVGADRGKLAAVLFRGLHL